MRSTISELQHTNRIQPKILGVTLALLVVSGIKPYDDLTWWLEVTPILIALPILIATFKDYRLTSLVYWLLFVHALIILFGAHYTYARVPLGYWVQDAFDLPRNHYDRLGHLAQGFIPAILTREILIRFSPVDRSAWLFVFVTAICLSISMFYEFFEWWSALIMGAAAEDFLALQGDVWDTQWDMFLALIGAVAGQLLLARWHNRQIDALIATGQVESDVELYALLPLRIRRSI